MSKETEDYDKEYNSFVKQLEEFHCQRGTSFKRLPKINGKVVDLYLLYVVVTAKGGWQKVNARNEWEDLLEDFRYPPGIINGSTVLKHIYLRYLDAYERVNFLGEDGEERSNDMDDEDSRSFRARKSVRNLNAVPLTYNHLQHTVSDTARESSGMSTALYKTSPYEKLSLSLLSPLPNENLFSLNVCTVLSSESRHMLQLSACPRLVEMMIAHAGVFKDSLAVNALDMLGNIAADITLQDPSIDQTSALLLGNVCQGVSSSDRAIVLRSLEILNRLALNDPNEDILCDNINQDVYDQICRYLTIHDIMVLIYTLECLYSLSSLGTPACNTISHATGSIHTLVSLLTVEAQSYGPEACIGMKVVETVTGLVSEEDPSGTLMQSGGTASQTAGNQGLATPAGISVNASSKPNVKGAASVEPKKVPPEVEEYVINWVKKNYEVCPGNAIEQAIVYRHFQAAMHAQGRKQGLNPVLLSNCVRKIFGNGVGPCRRPVEEGLEKWHYTGIKRRDGIVVPSATSDKKLGGKVYNSTSPHLTPTPILPAVSSPVSRLQASSVLSGSCRTSSSPPLQRDTSPSPILKAQLSAPLRISPMSNSSARPSQAQGSMVPAEAGHVQHPRQPSQENSSLIKSLLASKVTAPPVRNWGDSSSTTSQEYQLTGSASFPLPPYSALAQPGHKAPIYSSSDNWNASIIPVQVVDELSSMQKKPLTLNAILHNGLKDESLDSIKCDIDVLKDEMTGVIKDGISLEGKSNVLADLLEKTVGGEVLNGAIDLISHQSKPSVPNGPIISSNGVQCGVKRSGGVASDIPSKRLAVEGAVDGRMTLYVSQNGMEGSEQHGQQVVLSQGQQGASLIAAPQVVVTQGAQVVASNPQGQQFILQRPSQQGVLVQQGGQVFAASTTPQLIHHGSATTQKVYLHHGGQIIGGQVLLSQTGQQVILQSNNGQSGQLVVTSQPQTVVVSSEGSTTSNQGHAMLLTNAQGQKVVVNSGAQVVTTAQPASQPIVVAGTQATAQGGQVLVQGNSVGNTVFVAPQQQLASGAKTVIILHNHKMVLGQQQGGQVILPRQVAGGQQIMQVVSTANTFVNSSARTARSVSVDSPVLSQIAQTGYTTQSSIPPAIAPAPAAPAAVPVSQPASLACQPTHVPAPKVIASGVVRRPSADKSSSGLQYLCEWKGCNLVFTSPGQVYHHACKIHCPPHITELQCQWAGCDTMMRKRFSTMTHINDRHCNEQLLQTLALRRQQLSIKGKTDIPMPQTPPPHPGYAPNAAFHAIKRHALEVINHRDAVEKEGPVTKSIRLTSALILRNLVIYSNSGKKLLRSYESELANVALSSMESSRTVAQILYDIHLPDSQQGV